MPTRSRLKHAAAGLLGRLISRNNDIDGYWAPGWLYRNVSAPPHRVELDLLTGQAQPPSHYASVMLEHCVAFLRPALSRHGVDWAALSCSSVSFQFAAEASDRHDNYPGVGDPMICSVSLATARARSGTLQARSRCLPFTEGRFMLSERYWCLLPR